MSKEVRATYASHVERYLWKDAFWSASYFCATTGSVSTETVRSYIESQRTSEHKRKYTKSGKYKRAIHPSTDCCRMGFSRRVIIKNVYKRSDGLPGTLIVEDVGHDLSACARVLYLRKYYKPSIPFTVILIVDSMEDAISFSRSISFYHVTETLSKNRSGYYYILTHDIGRENKIFTIGGH